MRLNRGLWAGASLLLALVGCGKDSEIVEGTGSYSPIVNGISSNFEPAVRGVPNQLTAHVTNINNLTLRYHWSAAAGTITDTTSAVATWTPPDSIGTYDVTVSIEASDENGAQFFKTMTVHMLVDNQFTRWTRAETTKSDAAPVASGGALFTQFRNVSTGSSDIFRVDTPLGPPSQLTFGFFSATSPSARADGVDFAFAAKENSSDAGASLYLLPMSGGDPSMTRLVAQRTNLQTYLGSPRFDRAGSRMAYASDSVSAVFAGIIAPASRDAANLNVGAVQMLSDSIISLFRQLPHPVWGPDVDSDGDADSVMSIGYDFFGTPSQSVSGIYVSSAPDTGNASDQDIWLSGADIESPDWSPDGQYVVFAKRNTGTNERDIWIIRRSAADLSQAVRVTFGAANETQPRFSADGNAIFFVSNRSDRYGLNGVFGTERRGTNVWSVTRFDRP